MENPQDARLSPSGTLPGRHAPFIQPTGNAVSRKPLGVNPIEDLSNDLSLPWIDTEAAGLAIDSIYALVPVTVGRVRAEVLFPVLNLVAAPAAHELVFRGPDH